MNNIDNLMVESLRSRYQQVVVDLEIETPTTEMLQHYTSYMSTLRNILIDKNINSTEGQICYDALSIFVTPYKRVLIESLLLSNASAEDIFKVFGVAVETIEAYRHSMFDTDKLKTHLDKLYYVDQLPIGQEKEIKLRALNLGPEFIFFRYANIIPKDKVAKEVMTRMFFSAAYRVMEANYNPLGSDISKEALQWSQTMIKCFEAINKITVDDKSSRDSMLKVLSNGGAFAGGATLKPKLKVKDNTNLDIDKNSLI